MRKYEGQVEAREGGVIRVYAPSDATYTDIGDEDIVEFGAAQSATESMRWSVGVRDDAPVSTGELSPDEWQAMFQGDAPNLVKHTRQLPLTFCCRTDESHRFCCPI